jgi:non-ribosomal peptide synthetase component E (peptide arylation enzyme)
MYHKVPWKIMVVAELPLTGPDKVDKKMLRTMFRNMQADEEAG